MQVGDNFFQFKDIFSENKSDSELKNTFADKKTRDYFISWSHEHAHLAHYLPQLSRVYKIAKESTDITNPSLLDKIKSKANELLFFIYEFKKDSTVERILNTPLNTIHPRRFNHEKDAINIIALYQAGEINNEKLIAFLTKSRLFQEHTDKFLPILKHLAVTSPQALMQIFSSTINHYGYEYKFLEKYFDICFPLLELLSKNDPESLIQAFSIKSREFNIIEYYSLKCLPLLQKLAEKSPEHLIQAFSIKRYEETPFITSYSVESLLPIFQTLAEKSPEHLIQAFSIKRYGETPLIAYYRLESLLPIFQTLAEKSPEHLIQAFSIKRYGETLIASYSVESLLPIFQTLAEKNPEHLIQAFSIKRYGETPLIAYYRLESLLPIFQTLAEKNPEHLIQAFSIKEYGEKPRIASYSVESLLPILQTLVEKSPEYLIQILCTDVYREKFFYLHVEEAWPLIEQLAITAPDVFLSFLSIVNWDHYNLRTIRQTTIPPMIAFIANNEPELIIKFLKKNLRGFPQL